MSSTQIEELRKIEKAVHAEFGVREPTKKEVVTFLKTQYFPRMDGGVSAALLLLLTYSPIVALILSAWSCFRPGKKPPKCPRKGCEKYQVTVDNDGKSVCSNGHRWRPA